MLFIREYDTKSLDRSSVSMIDKYNVRLNTVGELLDRLSSLINNLLSLIRDIRNILGQSKQRIYDNLDQVKEVIDGNGITGTEATIKTIEGALEAGDKAIDEAETTLDNVGRAIDCSEEYCDDAIEDVKCGESCNETPSTEPSSCGQPGTPDCSFCSYDSRDNEGIQSTDCTVCSFGDCNVDVTTGDDCGLHDGQIENCAYSTYTDLDCGETYNHDGDCSEYSCIFGGSAGSGCSNEYGTDCTFSCTHDSGCYESVMPENCTYSCVDGEGCAYSGDDCSYGTTCGQADSCNQSDCGQYDCGEPCGETCHMTTDDDGDCSETSCGECSDDLSDDDYYGGDDGDSDMCGEDCGDSCGL